MGNVSMEARDINYRGGETKMSVEDALKSTSGEAAAIAALQEAVGNLQTDTGNLQTTKANLITIAPVFSAETAYDPGDLVYYNGLTYRCVNSHEGEWDADDFAATTVANELGALKSGLTDVNSNLKGLLKYKLCHDIPVDTTHHIYSSGVPTTNYVCLGGCTPNNANYAIKLSNIESGGVTRYQLVDVTTGAVISDDVAYYVYLVFVDTRMLEQLVIS